MLFGDIVYAQSHALRRYRIMKEDGVVDVQDPNNEVSDAAKDFLEKLLLVDKTKRMTIDEAMTHPWLTNPTPSTAVLQSSWKIWRQRYLDYNHPFN